MRNALESTGNNNSGGREKKTNFFNGKNRIIDLHQEGQHEDDGYLRRRESLSKEVIDGNFQKLGSELNIKIQETNITQLSPYKNKLF